MEEILLNDEILTKVIKRRPQNSHKGTFGKVLLIGGNSQYGGAIIMATMAAINSGAGLVTTVTDVSNRTALLTKVPEAMTIDWQNQVQLVQNLAKADVILIGPGLGLTKQAQEILKLSLKSITKEQYLIIDGSAITLIAENKLNFPKFGKTIFTPHQKEWERLSGINIAKQNSLKNWEKAQELAATFVLKSARTQIIFPNLAKSYFLNNGTPAMATGGMGDTLAGMIAGLLAQFKNNLSILAATYLHTKIASDLAQTHYVTRPTLIFEKIPSYMEKFSS